MWALVALLAAAAEEEEKLITDETYAAGFRSIGRLARAHDVRHRHHRCSSNYIP